MMASIKRADYLAYMQISNRRDSGNYSESCYSENIENKKRSNTDDVENSKSHEYKGKLLYDIVTNGSVATDICGDDVVSKDEANFDAKELERLLPTSVTKTSVNRNIASRGVLASDDIKTEYARRDFRGTYSQKSSSALDSPVHEIVGTHQAPLTDHANVDVINRCDDLINKLQEVTQKYFELVKCYQKVKKICYLMIVANGILLICVLALVPLLVFLSNASNGGWQNGNGENENNKDNQYQICFACSDLNHGTFSLENLLDVTVDGESCCFKSIMSVLRSLDRKFEHTLEYKIKILEQQMAGINIKLLQVEVGQAPNTSNVIGNLLQVTVPRERIALGLLSVQDVPFGEGHDAYTRFWKLRWFSSDRTTILRGKVQLSGDGMNIKVSSEAYYFLYSRVRFLHRETGSYKRKTPLRYLVYRKRGSISSYIHEAKLSCVFNELSQEHSITTELILHLNSDDEIFISVDDSDKHYLATESGAHSIGLFEI